MEFIPSISSYWTYISCPPFPLRELLQKASSDFQIRPSTVDEFEGFEKCPFELHHEID